MIYMKDSCTNLNSEDVDPSITYYYIASSMTQARWSESGAVIGYPSEQNGAVYRSVIFPYQIL